jgi:hypothetical protein
VKRVIQKFLTMLSLASSHRSVVPTYIGGMDETAVLAQLLSYEQIRQLAFRYALFLDSRDLDGLTSLFVHDVRVGPGVAGHDALRASFEASLAPLGTTILSVSNHIIDLDEDGDHATGSVYCSAEIEQGEHWLRQRILYRDRYEREDTGWKFVRRQHLLWYSAPLGVDPRTLPLANWPASNIGLGSLPGDFH